MVEVAHGPTPPVALAARDLAAVAVRAAHLRRARGGRRGASGSWSRRRSRAAAARVAGPCTAAAAAPAGAGRAASRSLLPADLVLVAIGFAGVEAGRVFDELGVSVGVRGTVQVDGGYATGAEGVFAAGDCVRGADLIVTAIADGREAAARIGARLAQRVAAPAA